MKKRLVFNAKEVEGFSPAGAQDAFASRMLVDQESVGSEKLVMNLFTLKPGKSTEAGSHPAPFDEIYFVVRGSGVVYLGAAHEPTAISPDACVFIPAGTIHYLTNTGDQDLELITVMPGPMAPGGNPLYDARKAAWGTSFRLVK